MGRIMSSSNASALEDFRASWLASRSVRWPPLLGTDAAALGRRGDEQDPSVGLQVVNSRRNHDELVDGVGGRRREEGGGGGRDAATLSSSGAPSPWASPPPCAFCYLMLFSAD